MDYEKGSPKNLVQFSEYNDLAFTDTGVTINDNAPPARNVIWTSDKIEKILRGGRPDDGVGAHLGGLHFRAGIDGMHGKDEYYPNGYKRYWGNEGNRHHFWRVLRPSWWLSFIIPSRRHYCDKCCNYNEHFWATTWNDDPKLGKSMGCASRGCANNPATKMTRLPKM